MFANHWLVADMDGTLTPTPSRAHGRYLSLAHCASTGLGYGERYRSCLPWLRFFIERGGSLCVVTTAGKRMWSQLYADLAPSLFRLCATPTNPVGEMATALPQPAAPGRLYMCGFTGAAMFYTRPCDAVWADMDHHHPTWRQGSTSAAGAPEMESGASCAVPPTKIGIEEWKAYRQQGIEAKPSRESSGQHPHSVPTEASGSGAAVVTACAEERGGSPSSPLSPTSSSTTLDAGTHVLAAAEGRNAIIRFFEHASYVSGHDPAVAATFFASCLSTKYHAVYTHILEQLLAELPSPPPASPDGTVPHLCFAKSQVLSPEALGTYGFFLTETHDALVDMQQVPFLDGSVTAASPVAQVVVMGIPMRFFDAIFPSTSTHGDSTYEWQCCAACKAAGADARARIEAAGLVLKPQPNSVCIHRWGVDKGLCVDWLLEQGRTHQLSFDLAKALAFGDVPESVDRPLTEFPAMQFISLSPKDDAEARLAQLQQLQQQQKQTSPTAKTSTSGDGAISGQGGGAADGGSSHLHLVGGEEEGTALFLQELLTSCVRDAAQGGSDAAHEETSWFNAARVTACAERARVAMAAEWTERAKMKSAAEVSKSTL